MMFFQGMIAKLVEIFTGKDDLERVAYRQNPEELNEYLKQRPLLIPRRPKRFFDPATLTEDRLLELVRQSSEEMAGDHFEPWILEIDGKKRLPAFSSRKKMQAFSSKMSQQLNKVFPLGCAEFLLAEITKDVDI